MSKNSKIAFALVALVVVIALTPLFLQRGSEFLGSDDAGSEMVEEVTGEEYEPWFEPVIEVILGDELPGEMETFFFCVQTGIGVSVIFYCVGYLKARKKYSDTALAQETPNIADGG